MSSIKSVGASALKVNQSLESLARTDDMLAVLGLIMLAGVIISAYGSFWQGRLASAQFKNQCTTEPSQSQQNEHQKTVRFTILMSAVAILLIGIIIYIFRKQLKAKLFGGSGSGSTPAGEAVAA